MNRTLSNDLVVHRVMTSALARVAMRVSSDAVVASERVFAMRPVTPALWAISGGCGRRETTEYEASELYENEGVGHEEHETAKGERGSKDPSSRLGLVLDSAERTVNDPRGGARFVQPVGA